MQGEIKINGDIISNPFTRDLFSPQIERDKENLVITVFFLKTHVSSEESLARKKTKTKKKSICFFLHNLYILLKRRHMVNNKHSWRPIIAQFL